MSVLATRPATRTLDELNQIYKQIEDSHKLGSFISYEPFPTKDEEDLTKAISSIREDLAKLYFKEKENGANRETLRDILHQRVSYLKMQRELLREGYEAEESGFSEIMEKEESA